MLRKLLAAGTILVVGYVGGLLFGYRAAVVDYVENDAQTIESMAETMYPTASKDDLPEEVQEVIEESMEGTSDASDDDRPSGFQ